MSLCRPRGEARVYGHVLQPLGPGIRPGQCETPVIDRRTPRGAPGLIKGVLVWTMLSDQTERLNRGVCPVLRFLLRL